MTKIMRQERLLFAMSQLERNLCPMSVPSAFSEQVEAQWFDSEKEPAGRWNELLENYRPTVLISCWSTPMLPESFLSQPDCSLRYVCNISGSIRHVVPRSFLEREGQMVTNWGGAVASQVAEQALLLALGALRDVRHWDEFIQDQTKGFRHPIMTIGTRTLFGQKVGIHGFGRIARILVSLLKPFGVVVRTYSRGVPDDFIRSHEVIPCRSLEELFSESTILFECEALNPETRNSVTGSILEALPDQAVFVNVGRGKVVDEAALLREVSNGRIRAAVDVVRDEPVDGRCELFQCRGALISPHIGGPTNDRYRACAELAMENLDRYLQQQPLQNQVTLVDYDRST